MRSVDQRAGNIDNGPSVLIFLVMLVGGFNILYGESFASIWWSWSWWVQILSAIPVILIFLGCGGLLAGPIFLIIFVVAAMFIGRPEVAEDEKTTIPVTQPDLSESAAPVEPNSQSAMDKPINQPNKK